MVGVQGKLKKCFKRSLHIMGFSLQLQQEQNFSVKLLKGGDLLAVLPTGFGKNLIF